MFEAETCVRCEVDAGAVLAGVEAEGGGSALRKTQFLPD